ncbi:MAG: hypothetical protein Q9N34_10755 [Aquificota bacterium]|nr:hypothetical protein [Aquificota bacterium]
MIELEACEGEAPNFKVKLSNGEEHEVAAIVVATGFQHFDAKRKGELGYGIYPDVITNLELEQMFSREGKLYRPSNGAAARRGWPSCSAWLPGTDSSVSRTFTAAGTGVPFLVFRGPR